MPRPRFVLVLPLLALCAAKAAAQEGPPQENYGLRVEYREFRPTMTGTVQIGAGGEEGTLIDFVDDLGIQDERTFDARLTLKVKDGHKIRGGYMPIEYSGDQPAPRNFTFKDTTYFRQDRVVSSIKGALYSADYEWDFYRNERGFFGALIGVRMFDVDTVLVNVDLGEREQDARFAPIPVLGVTGRFYAGRLSLEGEFAGLAAGSMGTLYELEGSARLHLSDRLAVQGGYRKLSLHAKDDPDGIEFRMSGWQFGLELSL